MIQCTEVAGSRLQVESLPTKNGVLNDTTHRADCRATPPAIRSRASASRPPRTRPAWRASSARIVRRAIEFGLEIPYPGFNVFATGPTGAGKTSIITHYLEDRAHCGRAAGLGLRTQLRGPRPAHRAAPAAGLGQPAARGGQPAAGPGGGDARRAVRGDQYLQGRNALARQLDQLRTERFRGLDAIVREQDSRFSRSEEGFMLTPLKDGQALTPEQYAALAPEEHSHQRARPGGERGAGADDPPGAGAGGARASSCARWTRTSRPQPCSRCSSAWRRSTKAWPSVTAYLASVQAHIAANTEDFRGHAQAESPDAAAADGDPTPAWLRRAPRPPRPLPHQRAGRQQQPPGRARGGRDQPDLREPDRPGGDARTVRHPGHRLPLHQAGRAAPRANGGYLLLGARCSASPWRGRG